VCSRSQAACQVRIGYAERDQQARREGRQGEKDGPGLGIMRKAAQLLEVQLHRQPASASGVLRTLAVIFVVASNISA